MQAETDHQAQNLEGMLKAIRPEVGAVLDRALSGLDITSEEAVVLFGTEGVDSHFLSVSFPARGWLFSDSSAASK